MMLTGRKMHRPHTTTTAHPKEQVKMIGVKNTNRNRNRNRAEEQSRAQQIRTPDPTTTFSQLVLQSCSVSIHFVRNSIIITQKQNNEQPTNTVSTFAYRAVSAPTHGNLESLPINRAMIITNSGVRKKKAKIANANEP